ncbi:glycosyltransferase family 39 protein, partial [Patescibacteria group bacterium]|nr:glycosyltransferase family 39 protein [Patescibacteria group bacterium]
MSQKILNSKIKHFLLVGLFLAAVFVSAVVVWRAPALFKGYTAYTVSPNALIARNLYLVDSFSIENDLNVLLSSNLVEEEGHLSRFGNKLTSFSYAEVFKFTGFPSESRFLLLSVIIHALTLLIFTIVVLYLFNIKTALIFSLIYVFIPFNWQLPYYFGNYEFALFFSSLFFLFYFLGTNENKNYFYLVISGVFLALAGLSKETFLLIVPFLFFYLLFYKKKLALTYILIPFVIIFAVFWLPSATENTNIKLLFTETSEETKSSDFASYGHLFPDPYTYHFKFDEFIGNIQNQIENNELDLSSEVYFKKNMSNLAFGRINPFDRLMVGTMMLSKHISKFFSLEGIGGAFVFLLILIGGAAIRRKNKDLYYFIFYWIISSILIFSYAVLVSRSHLMDFGWALSLLITLGILSLSEAIANYFGLKGKKLIVVYAVIVMLVSYNFVLVGHVVWNNIYDHNTNLVIKSYAQEIEKMNISDEDIIAVNLNPSEINNLNYMTDKSLISFQEKTVEDLLEENKLNEAFEKFGVKYILGYSDELNKKITNYSDVISIASNSIEPIEIEVSANKGW